jgi:cysteine desulfurase/selenocysteine lyase
VSVVYLDNAATSWPKPECVHEAVLAYMRDVGASPGRSGHRLSSEAERLRLDAREAVAELVGIADPMRVIFTLNATEALNLVIHGLLPPGTHAVSTSMEHNSVLRPLRALEELGAEVSIVPCGPDGGLEPTAVEEAVRPETRLIIVNHASNVCGTFLPVREIGGVARARGIPFLVDAAQTAGSVRIDLRADNIDLLVFTGHKSLLGPSGTGGLVFGERFDVSLLPPLVSGGTGSGSEHENQPDFLPDKYESGTPNTAGIAGLAAGVRYLLGRGVEEVREHERALTERLIEGLSRLPGVRVLGMGDAARQVAVVAFTVEGVSPSEVARELDERFGIMCRPGLHCAPRAHRTLGTFPEGAVRFAPGPFTRPEEIERGVEAVGSLAR